MSRPEREHPRYAHEAAITLHAAGVVHEGRTKDVSRGGLCAELAEAIDIGSDVEVELRLVFDEETHSEPLRLAGRIAWCTTVDEGNQVGVAFRALDAERTEYLTMFLRFLDDGSSVKPEKRQATLDDRFG